MKVILKTYKYRMYPNKEQEQMLAQALRDIAETVLDVEFDNNNEVKPSNTNVQ